MTENYFIEEFDPKDFTDDDWEEYFELSEELFRELNPDDPFPNRELTKKFMLDPHPHYKNWQWRIYNNEVKEKLIGQSGIGITLEEAPSFESNEHIAGPYISLRKEYRRNGIGTRVLKMLVEKAKELGKTTMQGGTARESGFNFLAKLGGILALEGVENKLYMKNVDWDMIEQWQKEGPDRAKGSKLIDFHDVPEDIIQEYVDIYSETMNQAPIGELEGKAKVTPETRRLSEKRLKDKNIVWYTMASIEEDNKISGLTETFYSSDESHQIGQNLTGVKEKYRGKGLGKWLKAEMLLYIRKKYPDLLYIITGNADSNAPMLSINERMGFKRYLGWKAYKFDTEELAKKLDISS